MKKRTQHEALEQERLMLWLRTRHRAVYDLTFAIPNGGSRNPREAANLKKTGVKSGVPDLLVAVPTRRFPGLFIELKAKGGTPTQNQIAWLDRLADSGYAVVVCNGWEAARNAITDYLEEDDHAAIDDCTVVSE